MKWEQIKDISSSMEQREQGFRWKKNEDGTVKEEQVNRGLEYKIKLPWSWNGLQNKVHIYSEFCANTFNAASSALEKLKEYIWEHNMTMSVPVYQKDIVFYKTQKSGNMNIWSTIALKIQRSRSQGVL